MTGQEAIDSFLVYYDRVTSFSAPGYTDDEILLFLNNAQDQFIKDKVFGENFRPPAFEDNQKRVVDVLPLVKRTLISSGDISTSSLYGTSSYQVDKSVILSNRILYTVEFEAQITRANPAIVDEYIKCEPIKSAYIGNFIESTTNKTYFIYPKLVEDADYYYIICDSHTSAVLNSRVMVVRKPYPITKTMLEYDIYDATHMNLHMSVHQEIVDLAVQQALQTISDPRWQTKVSQEQIDTN